MKQSTKQTVLMITVYKRKKKKDAQCNNWTSFCNIWNIKGLKILSCTGLQEQSVQQLPRGFHL